MSEDRFIVVEVVGWPITSAATSSGRKPTPSYSVLDTCNAYKELGRFYGGASVAYLERKAYEFCRDLNRTERQWEAEHASAT